MGSKISRHSKSSSAASSCASSASAAKTKAAARRAMLQAEAANLRSYEAIQKEELTPQLRKKALELQTEIARHNQKNSFTAQLKRLMSKILPRISDRKMNLWHSHLLKNSSQNSSQYLRMSYLWFNENLDLSMTKRNQKQIA